MTIAIEAEPTSLDAFIRQKELLKLIPISAATLWRKVSEGTFPKPKKLSERVTAWRKLDIQAWLESQPIAAEDDSNAA